MRTQSRAKFLRETEDGREKAGAGRASRWCGQCAWSRRGRPPV